MQSLSLMEEHEDLLHKLRIQTAEEYNTDQIKLDTEVQVHTQKKHLENNLETQFRVHSSFSLSDFCVCRM